ncbi:hypothetical protein [Pseudomonas viridiflava]|uniref:hypothetical protein n=1 Tax=Pseudomonas viridiflava TaxID=33069 RepID=UPI000F04164F|nr:hypothetical protein [Pseudomonas viridiflava]
MSTLRDAFCRAAVSLPLTRNDYVVRKEAPVGDITVDLQVEKFAGGVFDRFYVMIKRVEGKPTADRSFMVRAKELEKLLGDSVYVAIVKQDGTQMMVDRALKERMLYLPEKLVIEDLVLSGPTPNKGRSI